ncbi:MAG TPA: hypothetical protein VNG71_12465 [Pyrinomonadaceae bacterium]|nr:hypothetical protein [Pyrinomonadaceae bacterium]
MKRLFTAALLVVVVMLAATCPYSQTRPRRVTQPNNTTAETSRNRTAETPVERTTERPVERPRNRNWMRILGTAVSIGAGGGGCTPSRDVFRRRPRL